MGYFLLRLPNDLRIEGKNHSFECTSSKSMHEMDITSINHENNGRIKENEDLYFCFCGGSEKSRFECMALKGAGVLMIFLNLSYEKELTGSFITWFLILLGCLVDTRVPPRIL